MNHTKEYLDKMVALAEQRDKQHILNARKTDPTDYECEFCGDTGEEYRDEYDSMGDLVGVGTMGPYKCICKLDIE